MSFTKLFGFVLLAGAAAGTASLGCYNTSGDCNLFNCGTGGGTTTGTDTSSNGGNGGSGAGTPEGCRPGEASGPVAGGCGIFVSPEGADGNLGTKESPVKTLAAAIAKAKDSGARVYACSQSFTEALVVDTDVTIYGGLDCDKSWAYVGTTARTTLTAAADVVPLRVATGVKLTMEDVDVIAVDATAPGGSSIAVIAESMASLDLTRAQVQAGMGADGADGQSFSETAASGTPGSPGVIACSAAQTVTANAPVNRCGDVDSVGGSGGNGAPVQGSAGNPGTPGDNLNGGVGESATACKLGTGGSAGVDGMAGAGAIGFGVIGDAGYFGVPGDNGTPGVPAQGGGGGGGSKGGTGAGKCTDSMKAAGASGGSGGSGGCGGKGGNGGGAGGSSIAIVSIDAKLAFEAVIVTARNGGSGGAGSDGQFGGMGAPGGAGGMLPAGATMLKTGCQGGGGGNGGTGGKGGGGLGGHSIGIAHIGAAPDANGAMITVNMAGNGGDGDGVDDTTKGASGVVAQVQVF